VRRNGGDALEKITLRYAINQVSSFLTRVDTLKHELCHIDCLQAAEPSSQYGSQKKQLDGISCFMCILAYLDQ